MAQQNYQRTVPQLERVASQFWPPDLSEEAAKMSIIPLLLDTQDKFISILGVPVHTLDDLFNIVNTSAFAGNLFLKHLEVLADMGGEMLQRINSRFATLFPNGAMEYLRDGTPHTWQFQALPVTSLTNSRLHVTGRQLAKEYTLDPLLQDVAALLIYGGASTNEETASILSKCEIGDYLGEPEKLERFIRQRYIWVSRITMGSRSNNLGQLAQQFVLDYLQKNLGIPGAVIQSNGTLPGVSHTDSQTNRATTFDIVVSHNSKYVAIEVSFQVTTNSVIERKAGQARVRHEQVTNAGHKIAYVLDGAGNFQRRTALQTICSFSHCTVAFSKAELAVLCDFLEDILR
jgi:hypothetical protein